MNYFVVKYSGPFGYIKPWTAVRDGNTSGIATFSQQFLTPSIIEGIEKKLFPELREQKGIKRILRHRLSYEAISSQMEQTQPRGWNIKKNLKIAERPRGILTRGVMINPKLLFAFGQLRDAQVASEQHICLCRNEDLLYPDGQITEVSEADFDIDTTRFSGFELLFGESEESFLAGYNRFAESAPMRGRLSIVGVPVKTALNE